MASRGSQLLHLANIVACFEIVFQMGRGKMWLHHDEEWWRLNWAWRERLFFRDCLSVVSVDCQFCSNINQKKSA